MYRRGVFRQYSLSVPVISIGNLVLGGTGKTPTVRYVAELLLRNCYRPAIISRGYGGKAKQKFNIVSDGRTMLLTPEEAGDEPYMLAETLPGVPVLTGTKRLHPCQAAIDEYKCDVLILDDGFQHLAIKRNLDLVLFDATVLMGTDRVFPSGILREPHAALFRCDAFIITGINANNRDGAEQFINNLKNTYPEKPVCKTSINNSALRRVFGPDTTPSEMAGPFLAFCGIANPGRFEEALAAKGIQLTCFVNLPDHARYSQTIVSEICNKAIHSGAHKLVTTQKDFVKLKNFTFPLPVYISEVRLNTDIILDDLILSSLEPAEQQQHTGC